MKKYQILSISIFFLFNLTSCSNSSSSNVSENKLEITCNQDVRAYEFGREMVTWKKTVGCRNFEDAIASYNSSLGLDFSEYLNNDCSIKGYNDALSNIPSPYNKDGKDWNEFQ